MDLYPTFLYFFLLFCCCPKPAALSVPPVLLASPRPSPILFIWPQYSQLLPMPFDYWIHSYVSFSILQLVIYIKFKELISELFNFPQISLILSLRFSRSWGRDWYVQEDGCCNYKCFSLCKVNWRVFCKHHMWLCKYAFLHHSYEARTFKLMILAISLQYIPVMFGPFAVSLCASWASHPGNPGTAGNWDSLNWEATPRVGAHKESRAS